ncbi:hypothetical protein N7474_009902 [Penicillium riverlandense]|uniref:uncharacterized protein n=1 Tax=Penicillium riverlandense TaxID=1903569 RepID=UPI002549001F|nr:uncharacterized protein N7474_009902 [Penicillium riverlandense]KAJ5808633.1 hypothetical protein N7474_009902 [Penicillium riverlandense]
MTSTTDVIVLSSSPNCTPQSPARDTDLLERALGIPPQCSSPPPIPSPPQLFELPTRSAYFATESNTTKSWSTSQKKGRRTTKTASATSTNPDEKTRARKSRSKAKDMAESGPTASDHPGPDSVDSRDGGTIEKSGTKKSRSAKTASKRKDSGNMKLAGKVTKSGVDAPAKKTSKDGKNAVDSMGSMIDLSKGSNALGEDEELHLEAATRRRIDWTPPPDTSPEDSAVEEVNQKEDSEAKGSGGFGTLFSSYSFATSAATSREMRQNPDGGPTKRRRIELVNSHLPATNDDKTSDTKSEASDSASSAAQTKRKGTQTKRFTTLTARMTAQYSILEEDIDGVLDSEKEKPKRRSKAKSTNKDPEFTILSPEAAAKAFDEQDLMFGTCSQLEREDSPQTLEEMQEAIRASEKLFKEQKASSADRSVTSARPISRLIGSRNLWGVAARNTDGSLIRAEGLDKVDLTEPKEASMSIHKQDEFDWLEIDCGEPKSDSRTKTQLPEQSAPRCQAAITATQPSKDTENSDPPVSPQQPSMPQYSGFTDAELSKQVAAYGFKSVRGRKKMIDLLQKCWHSKHGRGNKSAGPTQQPEKPKARISAKTQISAPSKPKRTKTDSKSFSKNLQNSPKGKQTSRSFIDVDEIQDSEEEILPSPSQVQKRYTDIYSSKSSSASEPSLDMSPTAPSPPSPTKRKTAAPRKPSSTRPPSSAPITKPATRPDTSRRSSLPDLGTQVTKAVHAQKQSPLSSMSKSRSNPTWHEKILMYDPIVLEDFTTWLNVEGLGLVGEDREISAGSVREWCEGKGVCCCWKNKASW